MTDLTMIGIAFSAGASAVAFSGKWLFATKGDLNACESRQTAALTAHAEEERKQNQAEYRRLFDKMDAMVTHIADLRVDVAKIASENRYSRRRASDPETT